MTKDQIWVREGVLPDYPNNKAPQFDFGNAQLVVPHPPTNREEIQEPFVREQQIDPREFYPAGYEPELLEEWPVDGDLVVPYDQLPENMKASMSDRWRQRVKNNEILEKQAEEEGREQE